MEKNFRIIVSSELIYNHLNVVHRKMFKFSLETIEKL